MIKKITIFICFLILSVSKTGAFLSSDLWLNLYKEIDEWMYNLEKTQLDFELKWWDSGKTLTDNLNSYLETTFWKWCIKPWLTSEQLDKIANTWDINTLNNSIKDDCKENWISNINVALYTQWMKTFLNDAKNRANNKSNNIYEISKIWLFTDWTTDNSQFDLIVDLQEIDKIIFWEELEYNWEEWTKDFLDKFEDDPFIDWEVSQWENNWNNNNWWDNWNNNNWWDNWNNNWWDNNEENLINNDEDNTDISTISDWNNYVCPQSNNQSWLDPNELNDLENDLEKNNHELNFTFKTTPQWHLKLPDSNKINTNAWNWWNNNFFVWTVLNPNLSWNYNIVNDNNQWKCSPDSFFCITIEFITSDHKLLWYWKDKSIADVIKMSNKHLKKWANTSLMQAKMWTNNFENILRDLDFPNMFHMWMIITTKSPPILNLERTKDKLVYENSSKFYKRNLELRYKSQWLEYDRKNDLSKLMKKEKKLKNLIDNAALNPSFSKTKSQQLYTIENETNRENKIYNATQLKLINQGSLKDFYQEFVEYEKFIYALEDYTTNVFTYVLKLRNKPRWD